MTLVEMSRPLTVSDNRRVEVEHALRPPRGRLAVLVFEGGLLFLLLLLRFYLDGVNVRSPDSRPGRSGGGDS